MQNNRNCLICNQEIKDKWLLVHPKRIRKFCSIKCSLKNAHQLNSKKDSRTKFECNYCGELFKNYLSNTKANKKTYCSKKCLGLANGQRKGEKSPNWAGGITAYINQRCNSDWWIKLRKQIYKRDNYTCQQCGKTKCKLECHHIIPERLGGNHDLFNLISLCGSCHKLTEWQIRKGEVFKNNITYKYFVAQYV